ncbi:hypothetical protein [Actinokineospora iranica]|uniref:hypothetical protein n=1 Tax=Actinokineospora iranica TaxID=1271860 RepID=UPI000B877759|nr:hypothetical protein [Actinokineospora iranica]
MALASASAITAGGIPAASANDSNPFRRPVDGETAPPHESVSTNFSLTIARVRVVIAALRAQLAARLLEPEPELAHTSTGGRSAGAGVRIRANPVNGAVLSLLQQDEVLAVRCLSTLPTTQDGYRWARVFQPRTKVTGWVRSTLITTGAAATTCS